jgi:Protein of unknown function with PCYCGC motif
MLSQARSPHDTNPGFGVRLVVSLALVLLVVPAIAGCGAAHPSSAAWTALPMAPMTSAPVSNPGSAMTQAMTTAWAARPAYVNTDADTAEAYAYAATAPQILEWIPCYCGCVGMGHRSNLDCYFKPTMSGLNDIRFEEHASGCRVCVDETLMAKRMAAQGASPRAIRDAVDHAFGGSAPGTNTELPPA